VPRDSAEKVADLRQEGKTDMRFTGERLFMGRVIDVRADRRCRVQLDDGREVVALATELTHGLYRLIPGERVCVSVCGNEEPVLTGYLD
jgi:hypothetical protein